MTNKDWQLRDAIRDDVSIGAICRSKSLGIQQMPYGYALMQNEDGYWYWLRFNGVNSVISWNKWDAWRGANADYIKDVEMPNETKNDKNLSKQT